MIRGVSRGKTIRSEPEQTAAGGDRDLAVTEGRGERGERGSENSGGAGKVGLNRVGARISVGYKKCRRPGDE